MLLSNDVAVIIGFFCEALCYGVYCVLFALSVVFLLYRPRTSHLNLPVLACCTAHFALEFNHLYTTLRETGVIFEIANQTLAVDLMISICNFVGEMVLLYRCWILWEKTYGVVVIPFITAIAGLSCIVGVCCLLLTMDSTSTTPPVVLVPLSLAGYILPLLANSIITILIVYHICSTSRLVRALPESAIASTAHASTNPKKHNVTRRSCPRRSKAAKRIHHVMVVVVESGLLYLVTQLTFVLLFVMGHPAQAIVAVIAVQIYGIAPTIIILRIALAQPLSEGRPAIPERSHGVTSFNLGWNKRHISSPYPYHHQYNSDISFPGLGVRIDDGSILENPRWVTLLDGGSTLISFAPSLIGGGSMLESPRWATPLPADGGSRLSLGSILAEENPSARYLHAGPADFEIKEMWVQSFKDVGDDV